MEAAPVHARLNVIARFGKEGCTREQATRQRAFQPPLQRYRPGAENPSLESKSFVAMSELAFYPAKFDTCDGFPVVRPIVAALLPLFTQMS